MPTFSRSDSQIPESLSRRWKMRWVAVPAALLAALTLAAPAEAMKTVARATPELQKWSSPHAYESPYALVKVVHNGRELSRTPISRCKGTYVSKDLAVMISTCGRRWRVRANYVSMSGHHERFRIAYAPHKAP